MNKDKLIKNLQKILLKKARGFYYQEESFEYVIEAKEKPSQKKSQISMFDNFVSDDNFVGVDGFVGADNSEHKGDDENFLSSDECENFEEGENKKNKKNCQKCVTKNGKTKNHDVECGQEQQSVTEGNCNGGKINESKQTLTLSKKKVTTHFVPPDMLAIKMLLEINSKEMSSNLLNLSDEELLKLTVELKNELGL